MAPPNSTANRSSEIAPSTMGRERTKRRPSSRVCQLTGALLTVCCTLRVADIRSTATASKQLDVMCTVCGPNT